MLCIINWVVPSPQILGAICIGPKWLERYKEAMKTWTPGKRSWALIQEPITSENKATFFTCTAKTRVQAAPREDHFRAVSTALSSSQVAMMQPIVPKAISDRIDKMLDTKYMVLRRYLEFKSRKFIILNLQFVRLYSKSKNWFAEPISIYSWSCNLQVYHSIRDGMQT